MFLQYSLIYSIHSLELYSFANDVFFLRRKKHTETSAWGSVEARGKKTNKDETT